MSPVGRIRREVAARDGTPFDRGNPSPWLFGGTEPVRCLPCRLHCFPPGDSCRVVVDVDTWRPGPIEKGFPGKREQAAHFGVSLEKGGVTSS